MITRDFWSFVKKGKFAECWPWTGRTSVGGYGVFYFNKRQQNAHRIAYLMVKGEIAAGHAIDHLCRVRICVNPAHLESVTVRENVLRGIGPAASFKRMKACQRGHEYNLQNTKWVGENRQCRKCAYIKAKAWRQRNKGKINALNRKRAAKKRLLSTKGEAGEKP